MFKIVSAVIGRDLKLAMRRQADIVSALFFFVIVVSLFPLGIGPEPDLLRKLAPGVLWVAALLATMLSLPRLFADDHRDGTLEQLALAPHPLGLVVTGKVKRSRPEMVEHFRFLKSTTKKTAKLCIPAPTYLHMRGGRRVVNAEAYPDGEEFWSDITLAYRQEIAELAAAGLQYLQIDDVSFACLCDEGIRGQVKRDGEDPARLPAKYAAVITDLLKDRPKTMAVTMHTCRGNHASMWMAEGGYDAVAEAVFQTGVDGFFLEYDTARAGGFAPLRFVPKGKKVVLGLISTKTPVLEKKESLKRRIDEAAKYIPLENLCLSPQCGFASSEVGNQLTEDDQKRKLELAVQVAREVWS